MQKLIGLLVLLSLVGCASTQGPAVHDWATDVQNASTREAHLLLAEHYEQLAQTMEQDAEEQHRMLVQYQKRPHVYGKRIQELKSRSRAMILDFKKAAEESRAMADYHRLLADSAGDHVDAH
ncbi:MAG: hypothetical protein RQ715_03035 [Methylococcales bacterium]|nr:hypothetical protein [Methylococcales bacterium]